MIKIAHNEEIVSKKIAIIALDGEGMYHGPLHNKREKIKTNNLLASTVFPTISQLAKHHKISLFLTDVKNEILFLQFYETTEKNTPPAPFLTKKDTNINFFIFNEENGTKETFDILIVAGRLIDYQKIPFKVSKAVILWNYNNWPCDTPELYQYCKDNNLILGNVNTSYYSDYHNSYIMDIAYNKHIEAVAQVITNYDTEKWNYLFNVLYSIYDSRFSSVWDNFPHRLYLNLDSRPDRNTEVQKEFNKIGVEVERLPAIRLSSEEVDELIDTGIKLADWQEEVINDINAYDSERIDFIKGTIKGQKSCSLSHQKAIQIAKENNWPNVIIFEDDVKFYELPNETFYNFFQEIKDQQWDILYLGCNMNNLDIEGSTSLKYSFKLGGSLTMHACIINNSIYDKILNFSFFDDLILDSAICFLWGKQLKCFTPIQPMAYQNGSTSDITEWKTPVNWSRNYIRDRYKMFEGIVSDARNL